MNTSLRLFVAALVVLVPVGSVVAIGGTTATARQQSPANATQLPTRADATIGDESVERTLPTGRELLDMIRGTFLAPVGSVVPEREESALDHETRRRIHGTVGSNPGVHLAGLASRLDVPVSTLRYHVRVLEGAGLVEVRKTRGRKRLFPVRLGDPPTEVDAVLAGDATEAVLRSVARNEPATVSELASDLDRACSTVSYHLSRMADHGVVVRERTGEAVETSLTPVARRTLAGRI